MFIVALILIVLLGIIINKLSQKIRIPSLIGYILIGLLLQSLKILPNSLLRYSADIRKTALVIILIKAGLGLDIKKLFEVGRPALLLSFVPAVIEMTAIGLIGPLLFDINYIESFLLGSVIGAVSPAVLVPRLTRYIEEKRGLKKGIPQMLIAGSSLDDIVMIIFFGIFFSLVSKNEFTPLAFLDIPVTILTGVIAGLIIGYLLKKLFRKLNMSVVINLIITFIVAISLLYLENYIPVAFSAYLSIIVMSMFLVSPVESESNLQMKSINYTWKIAEIFLFVFLGASINVNYVSNHIWFGIVLLTSALVFRMFGVFISLIKTNLNIKEKIFVAISYLPKATIQATLGGLLLEYALKVQNQALIRSGMIILSIATLSILFTAPLGAILMDKTYEKVLKVEK